MSNEHDTDTCAVCAPYVSAAARRGIAKAKAMDVQRVTDEAPAERERRDIA